MYRIPEDRRGDRRSQRKELVAVSAEHNKNGTRHGHKKIPPADEQLTFKEAARIACLEEGSIVGTGKYKPPKLGGSLVESREPDGPFGAMEVGEGAIMPAIPAILNAVYDATGVRINEMPLTPERVYLALKKKEKK